MPKRLIIGGLLATALSPVCAEDAAATTTFNEEKALASSRSTAMAILRWGGANGLAVVNLAGKSVIVSDGTHQLSISFNVLKVDEGLVSGQKTYSRALRRRRR